MTTAPGTGLPDDGSAPARTNKTTRTGKPRLNKVQRWERDLQCLRMRKAEIDWDTIVATLGYASRGHAHDRLKAFMKDYPRADAEEMRDLEIQRTEQVGRALMPRVLQGDPRAVEVWVKLSDHRARLAGMHAPERKEVTVLTEDTVNRSIREMVEKMEREAREAGIPMPELP